MGAYYFRDLPGHMGFARMRLDLAKYLGGGYQPQRSLGASLGSFLFLALGLWLLALGSCWLKY